MGQKKKQNFDVQTKAVIRGNKGAVDVVSPVNKLTVLRQQTDNVLKEYDDARAKHAEEQGLPRPESMEAVWKEACDQQDTNEMLRNYMMQMHVMFQELFQDVYKYNTQSKKENNKLWDEYKADGSPEALQKYEESKRYADKMHKDMLNGLQSMARTIKTIAQEYRQGEMTKALYYHISEVRGSQSLIIATLKQMIPDQSILNKIADALEEKFKLIGKDNV